MYVCCVCVCVNLPFILDVRFVDEPAGVTQEEGRTGFLNLPSAVHALVFLATKIQPFLSLVDREVERCVLTNESFSTYWAFFIFLFLFFCEEKSQAVAVSSYFTSIYDLDISYIEITMNLIYTKINNIFI